MGQATQYHSAVLDEFVLSNREAIIASARARVSSRAFPKATDLELNNGIPVFLEQLAVALRLARSSDAVAHEKIRESAGQHGRDLLRMGLTIAQVVHDYGDVCQVITEMAIQQKAPLSGQEFQTLNLCLDDAIAEAVSEYSRARERTVAEEGTERLGMLAHELRNLLHTALLSFESIKSGRVAPVGSTSAVHQRSLLGMRDLIDRSLADVRLDAGQNRVERIPVAEFVEEIEVGALLQAKTRDVHLTVTCVDRAAAIEGDRQILAAAVSNLLQNAFKFTKKHVHVSLTTVVTDDRVMFDVTDECGGLPPGIAEELFAPFEQRSSDRTGIGLGLSICRKAASASGGQIRVRDLPGKGCVFTLDLPRVK